MFTTVVLPIEQFIKVAVENDYNVVTEFVGYRFRILVGYPSVFNQVNSFYDVIVSHPLNDNTCDYALSKVRKLSHSLPF